MSAALLNTKQAAEYLIASERFVLDEFRRGHLVGAKLPVGIRFSESDLQSYVEARKNVQPAVTMRRRRRA